MLKIDPIRLHDLLKKIKSTGRNSPLVLNLLSVILAIYQMGFVDSHSQQRINYIFLVVVLINFISLSTKLYLHWSNTKRRKQILPADIILFTILLVFMMYEIFGYHYSDRIPWYQQVDHSPALLKAVIVLLFLIDFSKTIISAERLSWHPSLVFALSFVILIILGTSALLLPNSTTQGISVMDALFTATSAVCVTGLIVVDTSTAFTSFGQSLILIMIQIGGLGFMTFTSFFGFFFRGGASFRSSMAIKDMVNEQNTGRISSTLFKIITFTLAAEVFGAILIYHTMDHEAFGTTHEQIQFALFHSISAFCNAGFSTLSDGLHEGIVRTNYTMHMIICMLIIVGGIGFPVMIDLYQNFKIFLLKTYHNVRKTGKTFYLPHLKIHTKLALGTTGILLAIGFITYLIFERHNTLAGLSFTGRIATSFFGAVTPRTAGFNTVNMGIMSLPTVLVYLLLMWIGASPGSTGGGLKTTTFAVAILNTLSLAKNKKRVEIFRREISNDSIRKALSVTLLSQMVIGAAIISISVLEPRLTFTSIIFECFSAFSTVGLTLGLTPHLGDPSKFILIVVMFIGRVGTLTLLASFFRQKRAQQYKYPKESVFIV